MLTADFAECSNNLIDRLSQHHYKVGMVSYDESKRVANLAKHGFDFVGAEAIFAGFTISREDRSQDHGELRLQTLGLWNEIVVFVVHTPRGDKDHLISIRKAERHEARIYWQNFPG